MAKAPKHTTNPGSKPLPWDGWMPHNEALAHIQQVLGGEQLAAEDLRLRLASGDVKAQERRVTPGKGIEVIPLTPGDLKGRNFRSLSGFLLLHGEIFLRCADVYRIWPIAGDA
jgi:hypothetical protein